MEVGESADEAKGCGFGFEDGVGSAAGDDEDVEFGEAGVGFLEFDVGAEAGALGGDSVFFGGDEGRGKGFGGWSGGRMSARSAVRGVLKGMLWGSGRSGLSEQDLLRLKQLAYSRH